MFATEGESKQPMARIELTPLIGVLAALLVLFLLSVPKISRIGLFAGNIEPWGDGLPPVDLYVQPGNDVYWAGKQVDSVQLERNLSAAGTPDVHPYFFIHVKKGAKYGDLVNVLAALERHSFYGFSIEEK